MASTTLADAGFPIRNKEGYADLTAYQALKKAQRAEFGYRPLVYICSPILRRHRREHRAGP